VSRYRCSACGEEDVPANLTWCTTATEDWEHRYEYEHRVPAHAERILPRPLSLLLQLRDELTGQNKGES